MSTLLGQCDSLATTVCDVSHNACENCADITTLSLILDKVQCIIVICVAGVLLWKLFDLIAKGISGRFRRKCEVENAKRKRDIDLQEKIFAFLKEHKKKDNQDYLDAVKTILADPKLPSESSSKEKNKDE